MTAVAVLLDERPRFRLHHDGPDAFLELDDSALEGLPEPLPAVILDLLSSDEGVCSTCDAHVGWYWTEDDEGRLSDHWTEVTVVLDLDLHFIGGDLHATPPRTLCSACAPDLSTA